MSNDIFLILNQKYETFSKVNKKLADLVRESHSTIVFMSIIEFSTYAEVSPASITRFSKELGYTGFPAFQKDLQQIVRKETIDRKEIRLSLLDENTDDVLASVLNANIENLKATLTESLTNEFLSAVETIDKAKKIYIIGLRSSYSVAYYFYFLLKEIRPNTQIVAPGTGDLFDKIMTIDNDSVLISIGFSKYTKQTAHVTEYFSNCGAKIIAITDSSSSPLSVLSDITLIAANPKNSYSFVSAMSIMNALVVSIGRLNPKETLAALDRKDALLKEMNIHY
jgi:DNA-binding MurR/RpiR family transcriptional regulator